MVMFVHRCIIIIMPGHVLQIYVYKLIIMKALKYKPSAQFAYNYTINVLSKCSNIISHQSSVFEVDTTAIDLRRSAH